MNGETPSVLWRSWREAARAAAVDAALRQLYDDLARAVERRGARCWLSGRCCHFDAYGHRLYVTGLEVAWVLEQEGTPPVAAEPGAACPYQSERQCTIHASRPLGCRIFFCQEGTEDWQQALYERKLAQLRTLHEQFKVPYRYMEWLAALREAEAHADVWRTE